MGTEQRKTRRNNRKQRTHLTREELLAVLQATKDESARDFAILLVMYKHALRSQEASNLLLEDIKPTISKMQELHIVGLKNGLTADQAITDHSGVPLMAERKALREWLSVRPNDGSNYLFNSQKGGQLRRETISRLFVHYCEVASNKRVAAGMEPINESCWFVHNLRHSRMQHLVGRTDLYNLKSLARHRAISSTMVYLSPDQKQAMAEAQRVDMASF